MARRSGSCCARWRVLEKRAAAALAHFQETHKAKLDEKRTKCAARATMRARMDAPMPIAEH
eukprot:717241-Pleurochrysis_carterae.AAC.2